MAQTVEAPTGRGATIENPVINSPYVEPKRHFKRHRTDDDADVYPGESVAARYDETAGHLFDRAVLEPTVDFLAQHAGSSTARLRARPPPRTRRPAA